MAIYLSNRNGNGQTDEEGHLRFSSVTWSGNIVDGVNATQNSPLGMSVLIQPGDFKIDTAAGYSYQGWVDSAESVTITTANPSNPRIDRLVLYVDLNESTSPSPSNNPGIVKAAVVAGTPAAVPVRPNNSAVNSAVGAGNPWCDIADIAVGNGVTQITNGNITDKRSMVSSTPGTIPVLRDVKYYTTPGASTWTKPAGMVGNGFVRVKVQAGGGAGGGFTSAQTGAAAGGGAGGYSEKKIAASGLSSSETVTVGSASGSSSFGSSLSATAGANGTGTTGVPGAGGGATGGDINIPGQDGAPGGNGDHLTPGGIGGSSVLGNGGSGARLATSANGSGASGYGGGGGGARAGSSGTARSGGAGAQGIVIVEEYY